MSLELPGAGGRRFRPCRGGGEPESPMAPQALPLRPPNPRLMGAHLEDERGAGLQLQEARGAEWLQHRVRVIEERGGVENQQGAYVIHDEAQLVGPLPQLRGATRGIVHRRGPAHHGGVVVHQAALGTQV